MKIGDMIKLKNPCLQHCNAPNCDYASSFQGSILPINCRGKLVKITDITKDLCGRMWVKCNLTGNWIRYDYIEKKCLWCD